MKDITLKSMKRNYDTISAIALKHNAKVKKLKELLYEPKVLEFIALKGIRLSKDELTEWDEDYLMTLLMSNYSNAETAVNNSEVYFCDGNLVREKIENEDVDSKLYINLEDREDCRVIRLSKCDEFESKHKVVHGTNYDETRRSLIASIIKNGQEESVEEPVKSKK